jgi:dienelactone hydrolase
MRSPHRILVVSVFTIAREIAGAQAVALPTPTGRYAVGVRRLQLIDSTRAEIEPGAIGRRAILARLWYPASKSSAVAAPYAPQLDDYRAAGIIGPRTAELLRAVKHAAVDDAPVVTELGRLPVIVFSPGNGELEYMYTALAQELASHGYLFVVVVHPGVSHAVMPDGRAVRRYRRLYDPKPDGWEASLPTTLPANLKRALYDTMYVEAAKYLTADIQLVLDRLTALDGSRSDPLAGRIDAGRIATFGHSYGGNVAVEACYREPRVRACISADGGAFGPVRDSGLSRPYLLIRPAFANDGWPRGIAQDQVIGSHRGDAYEVNVVNATHRSFMDAHFLDSTARGTAIHPLRALQITSTYVRAFLDRHFRGVASSLLERRQSAFPEVYIRSLHTDFGQRP